MSANGKGSRFSLLLLRFTGHPTLSTFTLTLHSSIVHCRCRPRCCRTHTCHPRPAAGAHLRSSAPSPLQSSNLTHSPSPSTLPLPPKVLLHPQPLPAASPHTPHPHTSIIFHLLRTVVVGIAMANALRTYCNLRRFAAATAKAISLTMQGTTSDS